MRTLALVASAVAVSVMLVVGQSSSRDVRLTVTEGTSMAAALAPDGRTIVIDLQGALWTLAADGGAATRILADGYDARQPSWSPDSRRIAFQAYGNDGWDIWTINADGSGLEQVTSGPFDDREPTWSPDGTRLAFSSDRFGNYDVCIVTLANGQVRRLTSNPANDSYPAWSPNGNEIAFVSDRTERGVYARPVDGATAAERLLIADASTISAPLWTPDGKTVAYVSISGAVARLVIGNNSIADKGEDVFPFRPQWSGTGDVLYTADGLIKRRPRLGGPAQTVPFSANFAFTRESYTMKRRQFPALGTQRARGLMQPAVSPDGTQVAFVALGDLWLMKTNDPNARATRVTNDAFVEAAPSWKPDGTELAFSSDRGGRMEVWVRTLSTGADRRVTDAGMSSSWSPDGTRLAYLDAEEQLRIVNLASRESWKAHDSLFDPGRPSWAPDGRAVVMAALHPYSTRFREGNNQVLWIPVLPDPKQPTPGTMPADRWFDPLPNKSIGMRQDFGPVWSPDGRMMAAVIDGYLDVFPVGRDGAPTGPPSRIANDSAASPSWTADSRQVLYQSIDRFRLVNVADGSARDIVPNITWTPPARTGSITVHAGRMFDGKSDTAQSDVDIVIDGNRITRVQPHGAHQGTVIDASTQMVLPGLIESHTHLSKSYGEVLGRIWLSFGITAVRNPAANAFEAQEDREAIEAGVRIGPRVFATGEPLDGTRIYYSGGVALDGGSLVDDQLERAARLDFDLIKTYVRLPDPLQKRIIEGAHRRGMPVTSHEIYPAVAYGADGVEHIRGTSRRGFNPKISGLSRTYKDVVDLLAASGMTITPTIGIQGGFQLLTLRDGSWLDDPRIQKLFPASASAAGQTLRKQPANPADLASREALVNPQERMIAAVVNGGGRVIAGTDSPINPYGLTLLMELEHYVRGGLTTAQALRTATSVPAEAMGMGADLGSIEAGKLADLLIVDGDPLKSITDIRKMRRVIKDGVVYDLDSLLKR